MYFVGDLVCPHHAFPQTADLAEMKNKMFIVGAVGTPCICRGSMAK